MAQILDHPPTPSHQFEYRNCQVEIYKTGWRRAQTTIEGFSLHIHHAGRCIRRLPVTEPLPLDQLETKAQQYIDGYLDFAPLHQFEYRNCQVEIYKTGWRRAQTTIEGFSLHIHHAGRCIRRLPVTEPLPLDQLETKAQQYIDSHLTWLANKQA